MDCKTAQQKIMPYIEHKLTDRETEDFIDHIRGCKACSEELEVYFTIYYALEQLEDESQGTYNMKELLENDLRARERRVRQRSVMRFYQRLFFALAGIFAAILIFTGAQIMLYGSFEETTLYGLFSKETEANTQAPGADTEKASAGAKESEQETNHKRLPIVTTPETEPLQTDASQAGTLQTGVLQAGTLQTGASQIGAPQTEASQAGTSQTGAVRTVPQTEAPQAMAAQTDVPQAGASQIGAPQTEAPRR